MNVTQIIIALISGGAVGSIASLIISWLRDRRQERGDAGLIFSQALEFVEKQNVRIAQLRIDLTTQEEKLCAKIDRLEEEVDSVRRENIALKAEIERYKLLQVEYELKIEKLESKCKRYEEILLSGPPWAKKAAREAGLDESFNVN